MASGVERFEAALPSGRGSVPTRTSGPIIVVALMWIVFFAQGVVGPRLAPDWGIPAHDFTAPWTYVTAIFLHANMAHIVGNTVFMLVLGVIIGLEGAGRWLSVFIGSAIGAGVAVTLLTPAGITIGASGIVFGYLGYIFAAAAVETTPWVRLLRVLVSIALLLTYGFSLFSGLIPQAGISWQAHLGGFIGGIVVAIIAEKIIEPRRRISQPQSPNW